jgi:hydrogenase maturation protease
MIPGSPNRPRVLIACVGNIFLGDDAFGVEVAQRLAQRPLPVGVRVVDFGIRGLDLAYALLDGYEAVVLVDAAPRGGPPGTLYVLEPELQPAPSQEEAVPSIETHNMDPARVLRLVAAMGGQVQRLLVVGCEPGPLGGEEEISAEMSAPVRAAVDEAVPLVESLVERLLSAESATGAIAGAVCEVNTISEKEIPQCRPQHQKA